MMNIILLSIFLISFIGYVFYVSFKYGIQPSISESYYRFPVNQKYWFTLFCYGVAFPAMILGITLSNSVLMFLAGASLAFVGAASRFKEWIVTHNVHMISAVLAITLSTIAIIIDFKMLYVSLIFIVLSMGAMFLKNKIWWIEILAFLSISYVLFMSII